MGRGGRKAMLVYVAYPLAGPRRPPLHRIRGDARAPTEPGARFPTLRCALLSRGRQGGKAPRLGVLALFREHLRQRAVASALWGAPGGRCLRMADYVRGPVAPRGATAAARA